MLEKNNELKDNVIDQGSTTKEIINLYGSKPSSSLGLFTGIVILPILYLFIKIVHKIINPNNCGTQSDPTGEYVCNGIHGFAGMGLIFILVIISIWFFGYWGQRFVNWIHRNRIFSNKKPDVRFEMSNKKLLITGYKKELIIDLLDSTDLELYTFNIENPYIRGYLIYLKDYNKFRDIIKTVGSNCLFLPSRNRLNIDIVFDDIGHLKKSFYKKDRLLHLIKKL